MQVPQDKKVVVISAGGAGCGKIRQLCKSLGRSIDDDTSVYVFVGKNKKLKSSIEKSLRNDKRFNALDFTPDINLYVKAAFILRYAEQFSRLRFVDSSRILRTYRYSR